MGEGGKKKWGGERGKEGRKNEMTEGEGREKGKRGKKKGRGRGEKRENGGRGEEREGKRE